MIALAHIGGVPLEELLPALAGPGAGLLVARAWLALYLRRRSSAAELFPPIDGQPLPREPGRR